MVGILEVGEAPPGLMHKALNPNPLNKMGFRAQVRAHVDSILKA